MQQTNGPEPKKRSETLDIAASAEAVLSGKAEVPGSYPHILPDYRLKFKHIGTEKQLFMDNYIVDHFYDVRRVLNKPVKHPEPILTCGEFPWEGSPHYGTVHYDEELQLFRMWYNTSADFDDAHEVLCYAESQDGVNWVKPLDRRCVPYEGHERTNIVHGQCGLSYVLRNPDPNERSKKYFLLYQDYIQARATGKKIVYCAAYSADGYEWTDLVHDSPLPLQHKPVVLYDPEIQKYVAYSQHSHHWHWLNPRRQIGRQESGDLIHWSPKEVVMTAEDNGLMDPAIEFHTACVYKMDSLYVGLIEAVKADPLWQVRNGMNWKDYFYCQTCLAVSRDGKRWNLLHDVEDPWLANGPRGSMDGGYIAFQNKPVTRDGKLMFYHTAISHKQGLNRFTGLSRPDIAVPKQQLTETFYEINMESHERSQRVFACFSLREDGYVGVKPKYEEGHVLTTQFVFEGDRLLLNADVAYGCAKVQVLDPWMVPYEGFALDDCDNVHGDGVWHEVRWKGGADVSSLWNRPVRLKIYLQNAVLYSFRFQG